MPFCLACFRFLSFTGKRKKDFSFAVGQNHVKFVLIKLIGLKLLIFAVVRFAALPERISTYKDWQWAVNTSGSRRKTKKVIEGKHGRRDYDMDKVISQFEKRGAEWKKCTSIVTMFFLNKHLGVRKNEKKTENFWGHPKKLSSF